jgi:hypothetical protein
MLLLTYPSRLFNSCEPTLAALPRHSKCLEFHPLDAVLELLLTPKLGELPIYLIRYIQSIFNHLTDAVLGFRPCPSLSNILLGLTERRASPSS